MSEARLSNKQWSTYWRRATITTFSGPFGQNYDREIKAFWHAQFERLEAGARIVDLGTGNGAIALLAKKYSEEHERGFSVAGIDYADIRPVEDLNFHDDWRPLLDAIEFRANVRIEHTGLPARSVNLLTSQYGFEYAEPQAAVAEARRILKPGGWLAAILHNDESLVVRQAKDAVRQAQLCLQKEKLDKRVEQLVRAIGEATSAYRRRQLKHNPKTEHLRKKLNAAIARVNQHAEGYEDPEGFLGRFIPSLMTVFDTHKDKSMREKLEYVRWLRADYESYRARMADLQSAALSRESFHTLIREFERHGFLVREQGPFLYAPSGLMGWTLVALKE